MLRSSFTLLIRSIARNKGFSLLNIGGLALAITCASFIFLWVENELTSNHYFIKRNSLYAVMENQSSGVTLLTQRGGPVPLADGIQHKITGIKNTARLGSLQSQFFVQGEKVFVQKGQYADSTVLSMLNLKYIYGDHPSLTSPESILISTSMANTLFGQANPVGKTLQSRTGDPTMKDGLFRITGVFEDLPENSFYHFTWLQPYTVAENLMHANWNKWDIPVETLVELDGNANLPMVNHELNVFARSKVDNIKIELFLFSMNDWNLRAHFSNGRPDGGKIVYINLFVLIAAIILLIGCINFINLSTARSEKRAKEVGIRKVSGAYRYQLILQFLRESMVMSFLAVIVSMVLITLLLPILNDTLGTTLQAGIFKWKHLLFFVATGMCCGIISGLYPAMYLSGFKPIKVLKGGAIKREGGKGFLRKGLVTMQFTICIVLMVATIIIYQQLQHVKTRDLGYTTNRMIEMTVPETFYQRFEVVREDLLRAGVIENAAMAYNPMLHLYSYSNDYRWAGKSPLDQITVYDIGVTTQYISTMHLKIKEGRDFYRGERIDSNNTCIVNETMAKVMGAEGKIGGTITRKGFPPIHIVGIVQDFIFNDMYGNGGPVMIGAIPQACNHLFITLSPSVSTARSLATIDRTLSTAMPSYPFAHHFVDEEMNQLFETENLVNRLASIFAVIAVLISCLGLFGLAAYAAERRTKEIGIRKVLGASVLSVIKLFTTEFFQLVLLSCVLAFPVAWWAISQWLKNYQYRINVHWWPFAAVGILTLVIALLTVSAQVLKTAVASPVKSLRSE